MINIIISKFLFTDTILFHRKIKFRVKITYTETITYIVKDIHLDPVPHSVNAMLIDDLETFVMSAFILYWAMWSNYPPH